jgi:hypothetical protein
MAEPGIDVLIVTANVPKPPLTSLPLSVETTLLPQRREEATGRLVNTHCPAGAEGDEAQPELRSWGAHPPRVLLDAPRVQPLACVPDTEVLEISMRPMFSARARKTAPEAGALPMNFGVRAQISSRFTR